MNRTSIIVFFIEKFNYKTYLEIGCARNRNFKRINIEKIGVDPVKGGTIRATSDDFFKTNQKTFDIIFIDGLHHSDQAYGDMINSLNCLNPNGTIVVHDCIPSSYYSQLVPQPARFLTRKWHGDVWRAWLKLRSERADLKMSVINIDEGVGIIRSGSQQIIDPSKASISYEEFTKDRINLLNIVPTGNINNII